MTQRLDRLEKLMENSLNFQYKVSKDIDKVSKNVDNVSKNVDNVSKDVSRLEKTMKWMWLTQWDISENLIFDNFWNVFNKVWEEINSIERNIKIFSKWKVKLEIDIIWVNWSKVYITETKTKLHKDHIDKLLKETIPNFKKYDRRHAWMKVFWVVWARVVSEKVKKYAKKKWLYIIQESNDWNAKILEESLETVKSL